MTLDPLQILDVVFLAMLLVVAMAIVRLNSLFAVVMLTGVYSLLSAVWFVVLDAVDVAFTEAAVGAGVSTVLMLGAMLLTAREARPTPMRRVIAPLLVAIVAGGALFYALPDLPAYGDANTPANEYVGLEYLERAATDTHIPNVVTVVLASYRGFDTLGETAVIFTAGLAVLLLLGGVGPAARRKSEKTESGE